jgi:hypothetical protein
MISLKGMVAYPLQPVWFPSKLCYGVLEANVSQSISRYLTCIVRFVGGDLSYDGRRTQHLPTYQC